MTREEQLELLKQIEKDIYVCSIESTLLDDAKSCAIHSAIEELEQEPCEDCISRAELKKRLQEHHDFFVNAYGGFRILLPNDKSRVDEIENCIAEVVNMPSVQPKQKPIILKANEKQFEELKEAIRKNPLCAVMAEPKTDVLDKIIAEIDEKISHYEHFSSSNTANGLTMAKEIVEKYRGEK